MKIEMLYPELTTLYGDSANVRYFQKSAKDSDDIEIVETHIGEIPKFLNEDIALVYRGTMTESAQKIMLKELLQYKVEITKKIEAGQRFLVTGNALELFGDEIKIGNETIEALGIFPFYTKNEMPKRYNAIYVGKYKDKYVVGFKSQFSHIYFTNEQNANIKPLISTIRGIGLNKHTADEGIRYKNFMGTYLIGPLLVLNPFFVEDLFSEMGMDCKLYFEDDAKEAYNKRVREYLNPNTGLEF